MNKYELSFIILILLAFFISLFVLGWTHATNKILKSEIRKLYSIEQSRSTTYMQEYKKLLIDNECKAMTIDIHKRQIKNLQAENDGLRTIINKDVKLKALIDPQIKKVN